MGVAASLMQTLQAYSGQGMIVVLFVLALVAAVYDGKHAQIPNVISALVALEGIAIQVVRLVAVFVPALTANFARWPLCAYVIQRLPSPQSCLLLALAVLLLAVLVETRLRAAGYFGMGMGDIKYIAAWATVLGWYVFPALALACLFGAAWALTQGKRTFAFAPWLSLSFLATLFFILFFAPNNLAIV